MNISQQNSRQYFLYFWPRYWTDKASVHWPLYRLHQNSKTMNKIRRDDVVWAFVKRDSLTKDGPDYVAVARFIVSDVGDTDPKNSNFIYGKRYFESTSDLATYLDVDKQPNIERIIRSFSFKTNALKLGHSMQGPSGVRQITRDEADAIEATVLLPPDQSDATCRHGDISRADIKANNVQLSPDQLPHLRVPRRSHRKPTQTKSSFIPATAAIVLAALATIIALTYVRHK